MTAFPDELWEPRPGESGEAWRQRVRAWFTSQPAATNRGNRQSEWENLCALLSIENPGSYQR